MSSLLTKSEQRAIWAFAAGGNAEVTTYEADAYLGHARGKIRQLILSDETIAKKFKACTKDGHYYVNCDAVRKHYRKPLYQSA